MFRGKQQNKELRKTHGPPVLSGMRSQYLLPNKWVWSNFIAVSWKGEQREIKIQNSNMENENDLRGTAVSLCCTFYAWMFEICLLNVQRVSVYFLLGWALYLRLQLCWGSWNHLKLYTSAWYRKARVWIVRRGPGFRCLRFWSHSMGLTTILFTIYDGKENESKSRHTIDQVMYCAFFWRILPYLHTPKAVLSEKFETIGNILAQDHWSPWAIAQDNEGFMTALYAAYHCRTRQFKYANAPPERRGVATELQSKRAAWDASSVREPAAVRAIWIGLLIPSLKPPSLRAEF